MSNVGLCHPIYSDPSVSYTPSYSGGLWESDLPLSNLADRRLAKVARSQDTELSSTRLHVDLGTSRAVGAFVIPKHTMSQSGAYVRFMGQNDLLFWADAGLDLSLLAGYTHTRADATTCATYKDRNGIVRTVAANVLRDAHFRDGVRRILMEPTWTNQVLRSDDFSHAAFTATSVSVTANQTTAPDDTLSADLLTDADGAAVGRVRQDVAIATDTSSYVASAFVKVNSGSAIALELRFLGGTGRSFGVVLHPTAFTVLATTGTDFSNTNTYTAPDDFGVESYGNGFYRIWLVAANNNTNTSYRWGLAPAYNTTGAAGKSTAATGTCYAWRAGCGVGAYPTSCIGTAGSAVTRAADALGFTAVAAGTVYENYYDQATQAEATSNGAYAAGAISFTTGREYKYFRIATGTVAEATMLASVYDSGWVDPWPSGLTTENTDGMNVPYVLLPSSAQTMRYVSCQIDDYANSAGYVDLARLVVAKLYTPTINMNIGASLGLETESTKVYSDGGAAVHQTKPNRRTLTFVLDHITKAESFSDPWRIQRLAGTSGQLYVIYDQADTAPYMAERSFLGCLEKLSGLDAPYTDRHAMAFQVTEEL